MLSMGCFWPCYEMSDVTLLSFMSVIKGFLMTIYIGENDSFYIWILYSVLFCILLIKNKCIYIYLMFIYVLCFVVLYIVPKYLLPVYNSNNLHYIHACTHCKHALFTMHAYSISMHRILMLVWAIWICISKSCSCFKAFHLKIKQKMNHTFMMTDNSWCWEDDGLMAETELLKW